jgi:hypothetical protein
VIRIIQLLAISTGVAIGTGYYFIYTATTTPRVWYFACLTLACLFAVLLFFTITEVSKKRTWCRFYNDVNALLKKYNGLDDGELKWVLRHQANNDLAHIARKAYSKTWLQYHIEIQALSTQQSAVPQVKEKQIPPSRERVVIDVPSST